MGPLSENWQIYLSKIHCDETKKWVLACQSFGKRNARVTDSRMATQMITKIIECCHFAVHHKR